MESHFKKGFTLIELLVVISIIGVLSSVVLASLQSARNKGKVGAGLKFATHNYHALGADAIAYYDFNNATFSSAPDISGNNRSLVGCCGDLSLSNETPTKTGQSLQLTIDEINGKSYFPSPLLPEKVDTTLSLWINPIQISFYGPLLEIVDNDISPTVGYSIYLNAGELRCLNYESGTILITLTDIETLINKWTHITCSFTGTEISAYINGQKVASNTEESALVPSNLSYITVGGNEISTSVLTGFIDDVAIYSQALTASQIQQIYAQGEHEHALAQE